MILLSFVLIIYMLYYPMGFPGGPVVKNLPADAGDVGSVPGLGRPPGGGNGNPLQYSCLENSMDRGAWRATVHGVTKESKQHDLVPKQQYITQYIVISSKLSFRYMKNKI